MGRAQRPIPFRINGLGRTDTLTSGARKALGNFINDYGEGKGIRLFVAKAEDHGKGSTLRQQVNSIYKKGGKVNE